MNGSREKFKRIRSWKSLGSAYSPRGTLVNKVGVPIKTLCYQGFFVSFFSLLFSIPNNRDIFY